MKKNIYKWHRTSSLIIAIPVLLWAISGFMHPIMTNVRPQLSTQFMPPTVIDSSKLKIPLQDALSINHIDSFQSFRIVHIDTNWFYQIKMLQQDELLYISTQTGKTLKKGDWIYAQYLARYFLEGGKSKNTPGTHAINSNQEEPRHPDCCDAAAAFVLKPTQGAKITTIHSLKNFDNEYKSINKLLPVYKVSFERKDGIRIYVETGQDRFAFAIDNKRALFSTLFAWFHTWEWLQFLGKGRVFFELFFTGLAFITSLMGIYIFFITKTKKSSNNGLVKARKNHRIVSMVAVLFTLMFSVSGFYHATTKLKEEQYNIRLQQNYATKDIRFNPGEILQSVKQPVTNIQLATINHIAYWQVFIKKNTFKEAGKPSKDLMKEMGVTPPIVQYVNTKDYSILTDGERIYAHSLANTFSHHTSSNILSDSVISKFAGEYGFINKRLPVWRINYNTNKQERYYIETASATLAAIINDDDLKEAYSFNFLHKHHFMDFAGKGWRDFSTMFWAAAQIAMVIIGLILYFKAKARKM